MISRKSQTKHDAKTVNMIRNKNAGLLKMHVNLRDQQLKTTTYCVEIVIYKPHSNHKAKICNRHRYRKKGI